MLAVVFTALIIVSIGYRSSAQVFIPEYCDWPPFPRSACTRMQFSPATSLPAGFRLQWQLWSALTSPPNDNAPFSSANFFRYVATNGAVDVGLTAKAQTGLMTASSTSLCIRFYYYVSTNANELAIYLYEQTAASPTSPIWQFPTSVSSIQTGTWNRAYAAASVSSTSNQFYLQIEATSTSLISAVTALARLSVTYYSGQCFDIQEEDIIPTTNTPVSYWPGTGSYTVTLVADTSFSSGPNYNTYSSTLTTLFSNGISSLLGSIFDTNPGCSLSTSFGSATSGNPYIKVFREPSVNATICASMVGPFATTATEMHLTDSCFTSANSNTLLLHVLAHALGLKHEHRRSDRPGWLILNSDSYDPLYEPFFSVDTSMSIADSPYDLASATQVSPSFLDQTGGRSPYGTLTSVDNFAFGNPQTFSHYDLLQLATLLGGANSVCNVHHVGRCGALCFNGGQCARRTNSDNGGCLCKAGFVGTQCQFTSCFPPCQNGFCDPGNICNCGSVSNLWTGYRCHIPATSVCTSLSCANGGTCIVSNGVQSCLCPPGYTGLTCSTVVCQQCSGTCPTSTTCVSPNRVNCSTGITGPFCSQCATGYIGNTLTGCKAYCSTNCSGHGTCSAPETCTCNLGWTGVTCSQCISGYEYLCFSSTTLAPTCYPPCSSVGGYCSSLGVCSCYSGYEGLTCDRVTLTSTTTPRHVRSSTTTATPYSATTTQLIRCNPKQIIGVDSSQLYLRYLLSPFEINFQVLMSNGDLVSNERQSLEDFLNRALRDELNRFTDNRFMRLAIVNVCPGVVVDVLVSYFTALNVTTASKVVIQQARAIGVPLTDGKTALTRLDFDYIPQTQLSAITVHLCTVFEDLNACQNGGVCSPLTNISDLTAASSTLSPLMTPSNYTWPWCQCPAGYSGDFCTDADLPLPVWAIVAVSAGGLLLIGLAAVTLRMLCGTGRGNNNRQRRYQRSHPLPPPPAAMPGYVMVPYLQNQPGTLPMPHPNGAPYPFPLPIQQSMHMPTEPPPPYHHINLPAHTATIPRSQIRADDVEGTDFPTMPPQFSDLPPPPGYAPPSHFASQPPFMADPRRTSTVDTRRMMMMMKRPKLGR